MSSDYLKILRQFLSTISICKEDNFLTIIEKYIESIKNLDIFSSIEIFLKLGTNENMTEEHYKQVGNIDYITLVDEFPKNICTNELKVINNNEIVFPINTKVTKSIFKLTSKEVLNDDFLFIFEFSTKELVYIVENLLLTKELITEKEELLRVNNKLKSKNTELEELKVRLMENEKLASIGQLTAGIAHELNNPIGYVSGNINALSNYLETLESVIGETEDEDVKFIISDIPLLIDESLEGLNRVSNIVSSLKEFSRSSGKVNNYNINNGVKSTLNIAQNEYKYVANINKDFGDIPDIRANPCEINEVILNLIVNAAQAIASQKVPEKKNIFIKTYAIEDAVCCEISDDGPGIPEDIIGKIFNPFFTTKKIHEGTGLGLEISKNIIEEKHKGQLKVESEVGIGTTFRLILPNLKE